MKENLQIIALDRLIAYFHPNMVLCQGDIHLFMDGDKVLGQNFDANVDLQIIAINIKHHIVSEDSIALQTIQDCSIAKVIVIADNDVCSEILLVRPDLFLCLDNDA
jgi:hypothetical protein